MIESGTVGFVPRDHWSRDPKMKAYDVYVDGVHVGHIERVRESTDRHYGNIRVPGKGRLAWAWRRKDGRRNEPGVYEHNRHAAVERLLA